MSVPSQNAIPAHPGVAAAAAAAGTPSRVAELNPMIPMHPDMAHQIAASRGPAPAAPVAPAAPASMMGEDFDGDGGEPSPQADWFGAAATGAPTPQRYQQPGPPAMIPPPAPPVAPASQGVPQQTQQPSYSEIDALLDGIQIPGEAQQPVASPQQGQPQPVAPQLPATPQPVAAQPQVQPVQAPAAQPAAPQYDAEAAQRAAIDLLMGREYALSEADQRKLIAEPEQVLPRLAAQVHVNVVRDIGQRFGQMVPQIVNSLVEQRLEGVKREAEFFARYPKLANPAFRSIVEESLGLIKQAKPGITQEQLFQEGASYAAFRIRSQFQRQAALPPAAPQAQPVQQFRPQPFVPVSPGSGVPPMPAQPQNWFSEAGNAGDLFDW